MALHKQCGCNLKGWSQSPKLPQTNSLSVNTNLHPNSLPNWLLNTDLLIYSHFYSQERVQGSGRNSKKKEESGGIPITPQDSQRNVP